MHMDPRLPSYTSEDYNSRPDEETALIDSEDRKKTSESGPVRSVVIIVFALLLFLIYNIEAIRREGGSEARKNLVLYWSNPVFEDQCLWYGTRELSARLMNLPDGGFDNMKACYNTPLEVNGVTLNPPSRCEDTAGGVFGHWRLTNDAACKTWWSGLNDKGCSERGSGYRRYEQRLQNLQGRDDWRQMCETTPADFDGMHFDGPDYCANWGWGVFGVWIVRDDSCR